MKALFKFFSSLKLTVVLLAFSILLVFFGTLDQVHWGIHEIQKRYFESFFVLWKYPQEWAYYKHLDWFRIPLPGGFLLGGLLVINLLCAHFRYFKPSWKRVGIMLTHLGVVLLLISGFLTAFMQHESQMPLDEGGAPVDFSTEYFQNELVLTHAKSSTIDAVTSIPSSLLAAGTILNIPNSKLKVQIDAYAPNAGVAMQANLLKHYQKLLEKPNLHSQQRLQFEKVVDMLGKGDVLVLNDDGQPVLPKLPKMQLQGFASRMQGVIQERALTYKQNEVNVPAAVVTLKNGDTTLGTWIVSSGFGPPQNFNVDGQQYSISLRFKRTYYPFTMQLLDFHHDLYPGTDIPLNFSSDITLRNPQKQEQRKVIIYMNHPLRYEGYTFFQQSFANEDTTSILMVVRNPSWLLPYISVGLVGIGMLVQFTMHLVRFRNRKASK